MAVAGTPRFSLRCLAHPTRPFCAFACSIRGSRTMATTNGSIPLSLPKTPLFDALNRHPREKDAVVHSLSGRTFTYGRLLQDVAQSRSRLLSEISSGAEDLEEQRVAILAENGYEYVVSLLSVFAAGGIAVPLCTSHPPKEQRYVLSDSTPSKLLFTPKFQDRAQEITHDTPSLLLPFPTYSPSSTPGSIPELRPAPWDDAHRGGLIIYTSGTTSLPKGVVTTHQNLYSQANSLVEAWKIASSDHLLHVLPLHHVHGIVNATLAPLIAGSTVEYLFPFNAQAVWSRLTSADKTPVTLFMAVPTIYNRLLTSAPDNSAASKAISNLRLAISGSAALPGSIRDAWRELAGTANGGGTMLERYGMTEIGMALSNTLEKRLPDSVGWPLPGVSARLVDPESGEVITKPGQEGEIQISGPTVFREYWNKPEATAKEFVIDSENNRWFKTGDVAILNDEGAYFIKGRASVDIIKTGGEKVSALEVERELLELPEIKEVAVVGITDKEWGQRVAAIAVIDKEGWGYNEMRAAMKKRVAGYKVPTILKTVKEIPRNQMGKINKKTLVKEVFENVPN